LCVSMIAARSFAPVRSVPRPRASRAPFSLSASAATQQASQSDAPEGALNDDASGALGDAASQQAEVRVNIVAGKDLASSPVQEHIRDRIAHAVRHLPQAVRYVDVKLTSREAKKNRGRPDRKAEINVHLAKSVGGLVRSERINYDANLYAAIDGACEAVERKLRKIKERKEDMDLHGGTVKKHMKKEGYALDDPQEGLLLDEDGNVTAASVGGRRLVVSEVLDHETLIDNETLPFNGSSNDVSLPAEVVRTKYFDIPPMALEEACQQMVDLGHAFFAFRDVDTNEIHICYKRDRGGFGVIIPQS